MIKFVQMTSLALALMAATPAAADVFGVKMGVNPLALGAELQPENAGRPVRSYLLEKLPTPHPEFELLMMTSTPKTGVCRVSALGRYRAQGADARQALDAQRAVMDKQYGSSRVAPQDDTFVVSWDFRSGANLPKDVQAITLEIDTISDGRAYLVARWEFTNYGDCQAQM